MLLLPKIAKKKFKNIFSQIWVILGSNYTVFIKFIGSILSKSRRMIIDCQLNSLLDNCLKTQLVGFRWADVLGLTQVEISSSGKKNQVHHNLIFFKVWNKLDLEKVFQVQIDRGSM